MSDIVKIAGGVTAAKGFSAACTEAGIKYKNRVDMAMVYSKKPCTAAGTFTLNVVKAAPVLFDKNVIENSDHVNAVVINAGIANACTGAEGYKICESTAAAASEALSIDKEAVLVASTGVIGFQIPEEKIVNGTKVLATKLSSDLEAGTAASKAIMTTDTKNKEIAFSFEVDGKKIVVGGMCKGSGMIHPNMGTMLAFVTTDAAVEKKLLQKTLKEIVGDTFNMVSVDGDTSTNDTLVVLANGESGAAKIEDENSEAYKLFAEALRKVCEYLAIFIAADGEGATKLFTANVINVSDKAKAKLLAKTVIQSSLSKAAVFGGDANWGRFLCALGYSGAEFNPDKTDIWITEGNIENSKLGMTDLSKYMEGGLKLVEGGRATDYSEEIAAKILQCEEVIVTCDMKEGNESAVAHGCDLSYDYVKINADYRS